VQSFEDNLARGREKLTRGDFAGALGDADAALAQHADSFEALQLRSRALYLLGRDTEALQTLRRAHVLLHKVAPLGQERGGDFDDFAMPEAPSEEEIAAGTDALETLLSLRERYTLDDDLLMLLAELAEDAGRYSVAQEAFEELVAKDEQNIDAWEGLLHVTCHQDLDAALAIAGEALELHPEHGLFHEYLGFIYSRRHLYRQALTAYRRAIEYGADHPDNDEAVVECYLALGETETALAVTHRLVEQHPNDAEAHLFAMEVGLQCSDYQMAQRHSHQLMRLEPSYAQTYTSKAHVEIAMDDWEAAERTLKLGFYKAVDGAYALFDLVDELISDGNLGQALRVAELAYELTPENPEASAARGKALREMGEFDDAHQAFKEAASLAPQDDTYQTWLGVIQDNRGDYQAALAQFNRVLDGNPDDVWTLANRGLSYLAMELPDLAVVDFNRCIELDPEDAQPYFWRACAHASLQYYDDALRDLRRAVDLSDDVLPWLDQESALDPLREDPRFRELYAAPEE
jgi:tetratricopeptide (TPR) repeat protein